MNMTHIVWIVIMLISYILLTSVQDCSVIILEVSQIKENHNANSYYSIFIDKED